MQQKNIAKKVGTTPVTLCKWVAKYQWAKLKRNLLAEKEQRLGELYAELEEFNRMIKEKEGYKIATSKEADARRKLLADIEALEGKYNVAETITISRDFVNFCNAFDTDFANKAVDYLDTFINSQIEKQKWQNE